MHYAVKTNKDDNILREIVRMGESFDCASKSEIARVLEAGARPEKLIFANSCKARDHIQYAKERGVKLMTFDCSEEAIKIHSIFPEAELILRVAVYETNAPCPMGQKFGALREMWSGILDTCIKLNLRVRGVSFHVGSGGCKFEAYEGALESAKQVFDMARSKGMPEFDMLDIGGGVSMAASNPAHNFDQVAPKIMNHLRNVFPGQDYKNVQLLGEPGRFIC